MEDEKIYTEVEQTPEFPGGEKAMIEFLQRNIKYPTVAQEQGIQGAVRLRFVIEKDGTIDKIEVSRSLDPSCDKEAVRVVKSMPKWSQGRQNGVSVAVYYTLPVRFKITE